MENLSPEEMNAIAAALLSDEFQNLIGGEEWDLTEKQEMLLWNVINRL